MKYLLLFILLSVVKLFANPLYTNYQVQEDFVPILGYHQIGEKTTSTSITYENFHKQVEYLTNEFGCNWITMRDLVTYVSNEEKLPSNACVMNFDDGAASQLFSMCSLNKYKVPATFYIAPENLGNSSEYIESTDWIVRYLELDGIDKHNYYMYLEELEMIYSWGHNIEAHTLTHANLPSLSYDEQVLEIVGSIEKLESLGFDITSFAYPFGNYDDNTLDILNEQITLGNLVIARDTEKPNTWRDQRSATFNISDNGRLHYYYIKPEYYTALELAEKMKYTNWWQFEENYYVYDNARTSVTSNIYYVPQLEYSYAILAMYGSGSEIETTFATKYTSGITVDILSYHDGSDIGYNVYIDGEIYYPVPHTPESEYYIEEVVGGGNIVYYNYYINIDVLNPGVHKMKISKTTSNKVYLDKFRVFSSVDQSFTAPSPYYYECVEGDHNCDCDYSEGNSNVTDTQITMTQMQAIIMILIIVITCSCCLCMNSGSNREFRKYGHIKNQREKYLSEQEQLV